MKGQQVWFFFLVVALGLSGAWTQSCSAPSQAMPTEQQTEIIVPGQILKFNGRYLSSSSTQAPILLLNAETAITAIEYSETLVKFEMPEMPAGIYNISIKFYDRGIILTKILVQYEQKITGISQQSFGINGGVLEITGQGFTPTSVVQLKTAGSICKTIESTSSSIKCLLPANTDAATDEIIVADGESTYECTDPATCTIVWEETATPVFSSYEGLDAITLTTDVAEFSFLGSSLSSESVDYVFMVAEGQTSETLVEILEGSVVEGYPTETTLMVAFSNLKPLTYKLFVNFNGKGFGSIIPLISFISGGASIGLAEGEYINSALEGTNELVIQGHGFDSSQNISISICSDVQLDCPITRVNNTEIACKLPELYDAYQYYLANGEIGASSSGGGGSSEIEYLEFEYLYYCSYCRILGPSTMYMGNVFNFSLYIEGDSPENLEGLFVFDAATGQFDRNEYYFSATPDNCWLDMNFGEYVFTMKEIIPWAPYETYNPNPFWPWYTLSRLVDYNQQLIESEFFGSNDNRATWEFIYSWTEMNTNPYVVRYSPTEGTTAPPQFLDFDFLTGHPWHYKIWRFLMKGGDSAYHKCRVSALEFAGEGFIEISEEVNYKLCSVTLSIEEAVTTWEDVVKYDQAMSAVALTISPTFGSRNGGTPITITGVNFPLSASQIEVFIHGVECAVSSWNDTSIECITGPQPLLIEEQVIDIIFDGIYYTSVNPCMIYSYVNLWSDKNTWGGELPPLEGETIYVPSGQSLLIDQDTGHLNAMMIEGEVVVKDIPLTIEANYIIIANGGKLTMGTPASPFQSKATIILHGNQETDKQLPLYGAKVIALYDGMLSIFGKVIEPTWTRLAASLTEGATTLTLQDTVTGWEVGDEIIVTSTSYLSTQTEKRVISSVSGNTIEISEPLTYSHFGASETYGNSQTVEMAAEVGLLSRSIVIKGDDEFSELQEYGVHILGYGTSSGKTTSQIAISYTEIYQCGQTYFDKRYPLSFSNLNIQPYSYAIGNSIHHSYARMINVESSMGIRISKNIGFDIKGNGITLQNGGSQVNTIIQNLVADVKRTWNLDNSDQNPSCFMITSPNNNVTGNVAAGSPYTGFYLDYDTFSNSIYNSYAIQLMKFSNNVAHSNWYGIYLPTYDPRLNPTQEVTVVCGDDSANPRMLAVFENCVIFKSRVYGLLLTRIGKVQFKEFKIVDSGYAAVFLQETLNLLVPEAQILNSLIVGRSSTNSESDSFYSNQRGIELPTNENLQLENIWFENFNIGPALLTCASCGSYYHRTAGAHLYRTRLLGFSNVDYRVAFGGYQRNEIFLDEDGSLIDRVADAKSWYLTKWQAHLNGTDAEEGCLNYDQDEATLSRYDNAIVCDAALRKFHRISFQSIQPSSKFTNQKLRIYRFAKGSLSTVGYNFSEALETALGDNFTNVTHYSYYKDVSYNWAMPFLTGFGYNIHWGQGIDFTSLKIKSSDFIEAADENILLRFNHTWDRETFDTNLTTGCPSVDTAIEKLDSIQNALFNTSHANYFHDNLTKEVIVNIGGDETAASSLVTLTSIKCRDFCPPEPPEPENVTMNWSNCSAWPSGACPVADENVTINPGYYVTMDIDPPCLGNLVINGELIFDQSRISEQEPSTLCVRNIWVQSGAIRAGTEEEPFPGFINIEMLGNKTSQGIVLSLVDVGNKVIAVTGELKLYGKKKEKGATKLAATVKPGENVIQVMDQSGWKVGDELLITPTEGNIQSYETRTIASIDETDSTLITLDSGVAYLHYGDLNPISTGQGQADIRANVIVISKQIVIKEHDATEQWGFKIIETMELNYSTYETYAGAMVLDNVRLQQCGQFDLIGACIEFVNSTREEVTTILNEIAIVDSYDQAILVQNSQNIKILNSAITDCSKFGIKLENIANVTIENNTIAGIDERQVSPTAQMEIVAGVYLKGSQNDKFYIENNLVTGVKGFGFVLDGQDCTYTDINKKFSENTAQSSTVGWYVRNSKKYSCLYIGKFTAAKCKYGITSYQQENQMKLELLNLIENSYSVKVLAGNSESNSLENSVTMSKMFFMALGRSNCSSCYSSYSLCSNQHAIEFIGFTLSYQSFPPTEYTSNTLETIFNICSEGGLSMKTKIIDSEFRGFYGDSSPGTYSACKNNRVFVTNRDTLDGASSIYLQNTQCINCNLAGLANYDEIYGVGTSACGDYNCTGLQNIMISDETGGFINENPSQIVPEFQAGYGNIINGVSCEHSEDLPGYICLGERFGLLLAQSKDSDMRTRIISPLNITRFGEAENNQTLMFQNLVNSFRSKRCEAEFYEDKYWQRFIGLIQLNAEYAINYGTKILPANTFYQLQETSDSDFVVLSIDYHTGQSIRVQTEAGVIAPIRLDVANNFNEQLWQTQCGANLFNYENQTIKVSLLSSSDCKVNLEVVDAIMISMYFETTVDAFYENDGIATFVDKITAYLGINFWQIKIVSFSPFDGRRLLIEDEEQEQEEEQTDEEIKEESNDNTTLSKMVFFIESAMIAGSTNEVSQELFNKTLKPLRDKLIEGLKSGNLSFHKRVNFVETKYASADNSQLKDKGEIKLTPNYTAIYEYQCLQLGNCEQFEDEIKEVTSNNSSYVLSKSNIDDDSSNNLLIIILIASFSALFIVLMGLLFWRMHVNRKKKLQNIKPQDQATRLDVKLDQFTQQLLFCYQNFFNRKKQEGLAVDQNIDIQLKEAMKNRIRTFEPLITTDLSQSPQPSLLNIESVSSTQRLKEKEKGGSDEELLKSSNTNQSLSLNELPPPMKRRPKARTSQFAPLKYENQQDDELNGEDVEVIQFDN